MTATAVAKCGRNGCVGSIDDGYCTECGLAPASARGNRQKASADVILDGAMTSGLSLGTRSSGGLGAGFVSLPPMPSLDPLKGVLADPRVPEKRRLCAPCGAKVSRDSGFCPKCGQQYSFEPKLRPGDVVAGQYEVAGPIAFGGMGWVYLAKDRKLKDRWCVLKGLLNTKDATSAAAAVAEREFLAAVKHPNIVGIYNFVAHGPESYIVMEHVAGRALSDARRERGPLPPAEAVAYVHRILPAFGYLHQGGMVYCDFKPSNVMLEADDVKLIDLGGVRRISDSDGEVYGTKGFFAPEIGQGGRPSPSSDLYTVARTLAVLVADFDIHGEFQYSLPKPSDEPVFARHESLWRFLLKATHDSAERRFQDAGEMAEQLLGVLRDVAAAEGLARRQVESRHFLGDESADGRPQDADARRRAWTLPGLKIDARDPGAEAVLQALSGARSLRRERLAWAVKHLSSQEARLRLVIDHGAEAPELSDADSYLGIAERGRPDWRVAWCRGLLCLARGAPGDARACFERVRNELPGELAPRLALGVAAEAAGARDEAASLYASVVRSDPTFVTAAFGLGRTLIAMGLGHKALEAWNAVPPSSSARPAAMALAAREVLGRPGAGLAEAFQAAEYAAAIPPGDPEGHDLRSRVLALAASRLEAGERAGQARLLGVAAEPRPLRLAAEAEALEAAKRATTAAEAEALVDRANRDRPWTLF